MIHFIRKVVRAVMTLVLYRSKVIPPVRVEYTGSDGTIHRADEKPSRRIKVRRFKETTPADMVDLYVDPSVEGELVTVVVACEDNGFFPFWEVNRTTGASARGRVRYEGFGQSKLHIQQAMWKLGLE